MQATQDVVLRAIQHKENACKIKILFKYVFENDKPSVFYPVNIVAASNIIATTGDYYGKTGKVSLFPKQDGTRIVNVTFDT